ncbi:uncharacterized protein RAG0_03642 [Rhynchosporium agropyri]|uniref:Uncharacterized protein n=1 Tax=Rhynchosporium agropyri TaxID=914238 RepID=A0A1E1K5M6_9HELO|nr:uncharacterized protein RAG0_03642 [Rhynchosporium agropyri]
MSTPIKIQVPEGTTSMYLTALSLHQGRSQIAVNWSDGSATFGATFIGPNPHYVLADNVFGLPIISLNDSVPKELSVCFKFHNKTCTVSSPETKNVGPQGNGTQIQLSAYTSEDKKQEKPTTVTILFQSHLHGLKKSTVT